MDVRELYLNRQMLNIQTCILDHLREGVPWPARPFKHTESHLFQHHYIFV